ncbi:MAG: hypothetical protein M3N13_00735 [Candidatus Eremiobacteraeota bacterium]|nr:hypothetical protein [Candidatus Eremiobacteraeota bacterium]
MPTCRNAAPCLAVALFAMCAQTTQAQTVPPSAEQYYSAALELMKALPEPPNVRYDATVRARGARFLLSVDKKGRATFALEIGNASGVEHGTWNVAARANDPDTSIALANGTHAIAELPLFNATWSGAYDLMRYGFEGRGSSQPSPQETTTAVGQPHVIAMVKAIGTGNYRVSDSGAGSCAGGIPGHKLHLIARSDPERHPLTDVTIDTSSGAICTMQFGFRQGGAPGTIKGSVELHLRRFGAYQMITDEKIDLSIRVMGISAYQMGFDTVYNNVVFPPSLPNALFTAQPAVSPKVQ